MKKTVQIALAPDTAAFLRQIHPHPSPADISDYVNSLLRQERFRQGFPARIGPDYRQQPITTPTEQAMLKRSGLVPPPRRRRKK